MFPVPRVPVPVVHRHPFCLEANLGPGNGPVSSHWLNKKYSARAIGHWQCLIDASYLQIRQVADLSGTRGSDTG
jgi:hypothetical protein